MLCALLPLGLGTLALLVSHQVAGQSGGLLTGALLLSALGLAMVLVQMHGRLLAEPLLQAQQALEALQRGDYDHPIPVPRLDESGEVLRRIRELGDYLVVVLPSDADIDEDKALGTTEPVPQRRPAGSVQAREVASSLPASAGQSRM
ncbi:MAG: hypothetical protein RL654_1352 [Pseudomonadota bacterium]|jgi:HAMP domain-containing protein